MATRRDLFMKALDATLLAVEQGLATSRIGTPVAARVVVHTLDNPDDIPTLLARLMATATKWLGGRISTLLAQGSVQAGHTTALIRLDGGQSLLVSAGTRGKAMPLAEVVVFGNHGVLSGGGQFGVWQSGQDVISLQLSDEERRLAQLVRQSQQTRQAVDASRPGQATPRVPGSELPRPSFDIHRRDQRLPLRPPLGVLLVAGDHTHQPGYAEAFAADRRCRLIGLCDEENVSPRRKELNARLANRLGIRSLPSLTEALHRPDVHIVSICAEPERRARIITQAAAAEKHLYLDKPLCASVRQAADIVAAVRGAKVAAHMFSQVLLDPAVRVRDVVASGQLGDVEAVHCDLCFAKGHTGGAVLGHSRPESPEPQQFELPHAKRELTNVGVYFVVMLLWLLRRNVRRVLAATENYFFAEHQARDVEDFGQMLLELEGGITASVTAARSGWHSHPSSGLNRVYLIGSQGAAVIDAHHPRTEIWSDTKPWAAPDRDPADPMAMWAPLPDSPFKASAKLNWIAPSTASWSTDTAHFLDCLEQGRDSEITIEMAAAATETLMAAYRSAATRRVVEIPLEPR